MYDTKMENLRNRRRFLQLAGTGAAASIAGCSSLGLDDGQDGNGDGDDGNGADEDGEFEATDVPDSALTAVTQADQEALQERQAELAQQVEDGDLSEQEYNQEIQQEQLELTTEATAELESDLEETDGLSVEGTIGEAGAVLVDGDAEAMRTALNDGVMSALVPGEEFAAVEQQMQMQQQMEAQAEAEAEGDDDE
ncbi:hypothetical protein OB955_10305 [Halobacteria archaeon AArc-m2/3/4]|uniref:Uncharacterized protein n=1 Tax=Natronoglomus mannanivorans TaxID=2979990 RepID=A0AAP2YV50_9EURY|nr:hypothetical protein [Halobacteria archaeon AArc-xg1-1]MCU4973134.1 hypothetical protein [Halobacteria archaeon AArc-m2/3/4]